MAIPAGLQAGFVDNTVTDGGRMVATYTDPAGYVWDLSDVDPEMGFFTKPGIKGWGATNYTLTLDKQPRGGVAIRSTHADEGRLTWPLYVYGDTHLEWLRRYRALKRAFLMTVHRSKTGVLRVSRSDGTAREIDVMYESGLEGEGGDDDWTFANPILTLLAPDGYWRDVKPVIVPRSFHPGTNFFNPFPSVSPAGVLGDSLVDNPGDVDAWPTWTITGPATTVTATHTTTGRSFRLTKTLGPGQLVTITTRRPTVRGPAGENLIDDMNWPQAYLWKLLPGLNNISVNVSGSGPGTAIEMKFYPRYDGA